MGCSYEVTKRDKSISGSLFNVCNSGGEKTHTHTHARARARTHVRLTAGSALITGDDVSSGSCSSFMSVTSSTFTKRNWFPSAADDEHVSVHKPCSPLSISMQFCKIAMLLINHGYALITWNRTLTHLLTPQTRVLLQKLKGSRIVMKIPIFYGR